MAAKIEPQATGYAPLEQTDGQAAVDARRKQRRIILFSGFGAYMAVGALLYYFVEGWSLLQTSIFNLSILTGVGFGHVAPGTDAGKVVTSIWIWLGIFVYASVGGQILDWLMGWEIDTVKNIFEKPADSDSFHDKRKTDRRNAFLAGTANAVGMYVLAVLYFVIRYHAVFSDAMYDAAVSVFNLDSVCTHADVHCSVGWHSSEAGEAADMILALFWAIAMFSTMGHFVATFAAYMGADSAPALSRIQALTKDRLLRMDVDMDGKIRRSEFLRDRLIQSGMCEAKEIDLILKNFDELDKSGTGTIDAKDVKLS